MLSHGEHFVRVLHEDLATRGEVGVSSITRSICVISLARDGARPSTLSSACSRAAARVVILGRAARWPGSGPRVGSPRLPRRRRRQGRRGEPGARGLAGASPGGPPPTTSRPVSVSTTRACWALVQDVTVDAWANGPRPASTSSPPARSGVPRSTIHWPVHHPSPGARPLCFPADDDATVLLPHRGLPRPPPRLASSSRLDRFGSQVRRPASPGLRAPARRWRPRSSPGDRPRPDRRRPIAPGHQVARRDGEEPRRGCFDGPGSSHCVLFFDEADAVFGLGVRRPGAAAAPT